MATTTPATASPFAAERAELADLRTLAGVLARRCRALYARLAGDHDWNLDTLREAAAELEDGEVAACLRLAADALADPPAE